MSHVMNFRTYSNSMMGYGGSVTRDREERCGMAAPLTIKDMREDVRYVVTKASKEGEFKVGDHIYLWPGGRVFSLREEGWLSPKDVPSATLGMECAIDEEFYAWRKAFLRKQLEAKR